jgi:hypothetical protein
MGVAAGTDVPFVPPGAGLPPSPPLPPALDPCTLHAHVLVPPPVTPVAPLPSRSATVALYKFVGGAAASAASFPAPAVASTRRNVTELSLRKTETLDAPGSTASAEENERSLTTIADGDFATCKA